MFWDSSAVVPLFLPEARSSEIESILRRDTTPAIWWATPVECQSAIYRRQRATQLSTLSTRQALERLIGLVQDVFTVVPSDRVRQRAGRLLAIHPIRAGDALQLAAALVWSEEQPTTEAFVCLDERLLEAAGREGFSLLPES